MIIRRVKSTDLLQIAEVTEFILWGSLEYRIEFLKWKYFENPLLDQIYALVAEENNKIIGFRGLIPSKWHDNNGKCVTTCFFSDAVVHPDHRGKNILSLMTRSVFNEFCFDYAIAISPNSGSKHIYTKLGAKEFTKIKYFRKLIFPIPTFKNYKICSLLNETSFDVILSNYFRRNNHKYNFELSKNYLQWKTITPGINFKFITSNKPNNFTYALFDEKRFSIEVYDFGGGDFISLNELLVNYCRNNFKTKIIFPHYNGFSISANDFKAKNYTGNFWLKKIKADLRLESELVIVPFKTNPDSSFEETREHEVINSTSFNFTHLFYV
jgi:hypothetical protein